MLLRQMKFNIKRKIKVKIKLVLIRLEIKVLLREGRSFKEIWPIELREKMGMEAEAHD